jgi:uncharacterized protein YbaR (Trm112 family)
MNKKLLQILVCPLCKGRLQYNKKTTELVCDKDKLAFPIRAGVPVLLAMDARQITVKDK